MTTLLIPHGAYGNGWLCWMLFLIFEVICCHMIMGVPCFILFIYTRSLC